MSALKSILPIVGWLPNYTKSMGQSDLVAALIVTIMLVPQSLAYAMLAGLPPQVGLYASILPLIAYAIFGTSRAGGGACGCCLADDGSCRGPHCRRRQR